MLKSQIPWNAANAGKSLDFLEKKESEVGLMLRLSIVTVYSSVSYQYAEKLIDPTVRLGKLLQ